MIGYKSPTIGAVPNILNDIFLTTCCYENAFIILEGAISPLSSRLAACVAAQSQRTAVAGTAHIRVTHHPTLWSTRTSYLTQPLKRASNQMLRAEFAQVCQWNKCLNIWYCAKHLLKEWARWWKFQKKSRISTVILHKHCFRNTKQLLTHD